MTLPFSDKFTESELEWFAGIEGDDRLAEAEAGDVPVLHDVRRGDGLLYGSRFIHRTFPVLPGAFLDVFARLMVAQFEGELVEKSGKDILGHVFAVNFDDLIDVLNTDHEFDAQAAPEVDGVVDVLEVGQQLELIAYEKDVSVALGAAERLLDGEVEEQTVDGLSLIHI